jgi:hypothetical protein
MLTSNTENQEHALITVSHRTRQQLSLVQTFKVASKNFSTHNERVLSAKGIVVVGVLLLGRAPNLKIPPKEINLLSVCGPAAAAAANDLAIFSRNEQNFSRPATTRAGLKWAALAAIHICKYGFCTRHAPRVPRARGKLRSPGDNKKSVWII